MCRNDTGPTHGPVCEEAGLWLHFEVAIAGGSILPSEPEAVKPDLEENATVENPAH